MTRCSEWMKNKFIAHRGLHGDGVCENSMEAFKKAMENNFAIENDVHLSKDGEIIVFHDDNLERMTGVDAEISSLTVEEIKKLRLGGTQQVIPTLKDVLELISGAVPLLIEVKTHANIGVLEDKLIELMTEYKGEFALQSFNPFIVKYINEHSNFVVGQLSTDFKDTSFGFFKRYLLTKCLFNRINHAKFTSYDSRYIKTNTPKRQRKRMLVLAWTVRSQSEYQSIAKYCDNIIFEGFIPKKI